MINNKKLINHKQEYDHYRELTKQLIKKIEELNEINQQRKLQEKKLSKDKNMQLVFHDFSHNLRTPLNTIMGFTELLRENSSGNLNDEQIQALNDIFKSSGDLLETIVKLINFHFSKWKDEFML